MEESGKSTIGSDGVVVQPVIYGKNGHTATLVYLPVSLLNINPDYEHIFPPLSPEEFQKLAESIRRAGILTPLCVSCQAGRYIVLDGHHRLRAAREHGIEIVPCLVATHERQQIEMLYGCNLQRRQLAPEHRQRLFQDFQKKLEEYELTRSSESFIHMLDELQLMERDAAAEQAISFLRARFPHLVTQAANGSVNSSDQDQLKQIADLQARLDEAAKLCRKLMAERDELQEAVELYEQRDAAQPDQKGVEAAVKHANKELMELRRRLGEATQALKRATDERDKLAEDVQRAKEREDMWQNGERHFLATELEQTQQENARLRQLLKTHEKAVDLLRAMKQTVQEFALLLDHTIDPWSEDERKPVAEAYAELVAAWESVREPLSLSLGGLPPGRSVFDRMFPDKRHREPLERFQEQQVNAAAFADGQVQAGNGRRRTQKTSKKAHRHPEASLAAIDNMDPDFLAEEIRREFGDEFDRILESEMPELEQIAIDDLGGEADSA